MRFMLTCLYHVHWFNLRVACSKDYIFLKHKAKNQKSLCYYNLQMSSSAT
jgi:hypothetical protein